MKIANIDLDSLYQDLGLELIESKSSEDRFRCPDWDGHHQHGDRTGKLYINRDKLLANCWIYGGLNLTQLVANIKSISYDEAAEYIRQFNNDSIPQDTFIKEIEGLFSEKESPKSMALPYFNPTLLDQWDKPHSWFKERGITETTRESYICGYKEDTDAIVLPHFFDGKLVGWQYRHLSSLPKYQNTANFPRKTTLWNYDNAILDSQPPIIVESVATALMLISRNYSAIATFGAQITPDQTKLLRIFSNGIILAPDNDEGGVIWESRMIYDLSKYIPLWRLGLVEGNKSDLADYKGDLDNFINEKELILV